MLKFKKTFMKIIKYFIERNPKIEKKILCLIKKFNLRPKFYGSKSYWENRYKKGGTSGSGSYNRLAEYKAEIINSFVEEQKINSIIEFGCGDGNQLSFATYPKYIGLDISPTIIKYCKKKFSQDFSKEFHLHNSNFFIENKQDFICELSLSLDVIFHLIEDNIFEQYMIDLFHYSSKFVIIYSSNFNSTRDYHEKNRKFGDWIKVNLPTWKLLKKIENKYKFNPDNPKNTSNSDFYIYRKIL